MWADLPTPLKEAKRKEIEALADDFMFKTQPEGPLMKMLESLHHSVRNIVSSKYTVGVGSGLNSSYKHSYGFSTTFSRGKGMHDLLNSNFLKYLQDEEEF